MSAYLLIKKCILFEYREHNTSSSALKRNSFHAIIQFRMFSHQFFSLFFLTQSIVEFHNNSTVEGHCVCNKSFCMRLTRQSLRFSIKICYFMRFFLLRMKNVLYKDRTYSEYTHNQKKSIKFRVFLYMLEIRLLLSWKFD